MVHPADIPLAAYIHWPWCLAKCPYCDFNSHPLPGVDRRAAARESYVQALLTDVQQQRDLARDRSIRTVFLGGGTPSLFTPEEIARVLTGLRSHFDVAVDAEITMEINPGALERGGLAGYREAGVNRVSFGAQSFDPTVLKRLGRLHGPEETNDAVRQAKAAGFERINVDVMHGLPGQTLDSAESDVRSALALGTDHISYYQLTLEPNTRFHAFPPELPEESVLADIADAGGRLLTDAGFGSYEVSAWAEPGAQCQHNLNYWLFGDYLAFGAGAHGKLTTSAGVHRYVRPVHPRSYTAEVSAPIRFDAIDPSTLPFEFLLNSLRLTDGFTEADFEARTGLAIQCVLPALENARTEGLIAHPSVGRWAPTAFGRRFLNDLQARFLP
ncbi:MAG: radical SAM family heme chaperone HemW [Pseudomonadota bacterium]